MSPVGPEGGLGAQLRAARKAAGLTQAEAAQLLEMDVGTLSRKERGRGVTRVDVLAAKAAYLELGRTPDVTASDETEPAASETGGLEMGSERELWELIGFYRGKQEYALENSEASARIAREASAMLDRAISALREVYEHTVPMPKGIAREITPAQQAALARAAAAKRAKREQDERDAQAAHRRDDPAG